MKDIKQLLCSLGIHDWGKWKTTTRREVHKELVTERTIKDIEIWKKQERNCERCNLYECRDVD